MELEAEVKRHEPRRGSATAVLAGAKRVGQARRTSQPRASAVWRGGKVTG
ncbi:MAG TPA: hypothetical protein VF131_16635 [Blastocatellia bacterium]|nr:hypothetical protein [Blastocatellia bacterium]